MSLNQEQRRHRIHLNQLFANHPWIDTSREDKRGVSVGGHGSLTPV
jgi:hypothetical protein